MKQILSISVLLLLAIPSFSKDKSNVLSRFNLRAGAGYAWPHAGNTVIVSGQFTRPLSGSSFLDGYNLTCDLKRVSFSSGMNATVGIGFTLGKHFGIEVAIAGYGTRKYTYDAKVAESPTLTHETVSTTHAKIPMVIMPALLMSTGNATLSAYMRVGAALSGKTKIITNNSYSGVDITIASTFELTSFSGIGVTGAIGGKYLLTKHLQIWAEASGLSMALHPKSGNFTSYTVNGEDYSSQNSTHYKYGLAYTTPNTTGMPSQRTATELSIPFSNIGVGLGISINL